MLFKPDFKTPPSQMESALWFILDNGRLLTKINTDQFCIPDTADLEALQIAPSCVLYLGSLDGQSCYAGALETESFSDANFKLNNLRTLFGLIPDELIWIAGRANQLIYWHLTHRYCGKCGHETLDKVDERAKLCPRCQHVNYPRLSKCLFTACWLVLWNQENLWRNASEEKLKKKLALLSKTSDTLVVNLGLFPIH